MTARYYQILKKSIPHSLPVISMHLKKYLLKFILYPFIKSRFKYIINIHAYRELKVRTV